MYNVKFTKGFRNRRKNNRFLGYRDNIKLNGEVITISAAMNKCPEELFKAVDAKKVKIGAPIYQNLLDIIKKRDRDSYALHRLPYKAPFVDKVSRLYNYEVDYVVRNLLPGEKIKQLTVKTAGKPKKYINLTELNGSDFSVVRKGSKYKKLPSNKESQS